MSVYSRSRLLEEEFQQCSLFSSEVQEKSDIDQLTTGSLYAAATSLLSASTNHYVPRENCSRAIQAAQNPFSKPTADLTHLSSPSKIVSSKMETARSIEDNEFNAIRTGAIKGVRDLLKIVQHPVDHLIQPGYDLSLDSVVIASKMSDTPLLSKMRDRVEQNPALYTTALARMHTRVDRFSTFISEFVEADGIKRIEIASEFATTVLGGMALGKGTGKAVEGIVTAPQKIKASIIQNQQLKNGIGLPVVDNITFNPRSFVDTSKPLRLGDFEYSYLKGDKNSLLVFVHTLYNTSEVSKKAKREIGVFFEASATIRKLAHEQQAKRIFVQFGPGNDALFFLLKRHFPFKGYHPFYLVENGSTMIGSRTFPQPVFEVTPTGSTTTTLPTLSGATAAPFIMGFSHDQPSEQSTSENNHGNH